MDPIPVFAASIILVSILVARLGPFISLVSTAVAFGLLMGMGQELPGYIGTGLGRIFSSLAVVVFSGAVIAEYLRKTGAIDRVVYDLTRISGKGMAVSGIAGYLIALPVMCSITAFMILEPVVRCLGEQANGSGRRFLFLSAISSVISFNLVYPSPVMVSLAAPLDIDPREALKLGLPISLLLMAIAYIWAVRSQQPPGGQGQESGECPRPGVSRVRAWLPLALPIILILAGAGVQGVYPLGNPDIALLAGALLALALARSAAREMIHTATRRSGVILLDLTGAGAFGYVVAQSGLGPALAGSLEGVLPVILLPFLVSAVLQLAQGSRVVTVVVAAQVLEGYPLDGLVTAFLIASGAFMFSYVTDPYFWLVKESTGSEMEEMVRDYTIPLSIMGLIAFGMTALYSFLYA